MSLLSPLALIWFASIPVLLWLWRLAATQRQTRISSLVPFLQLLRRPPRRRTHLVVNLLFWLQLVALALLALALAQPVIFQRRSKTILVVMDTSASMGARSRGQTAFERARSRLRSRVTHARSGDQYFIMASAPVAAMMAQPSADPVQLARAVDALQLGDVSGNLATTADIGRGVLGGRVDATMLVTDESAPQMPVEGVEFLTVGEPLPNVALVGLDAQGALCGEAAARLVVSVQNFSKDAAHVEVIATQQGHRLARAEATLAARERVSLSLPISRDIHGRLEVSLVAPHDALEVDNHATVNVETSSTIPVAVVSDDPEFRRVIGGWLSACQGLVWSEGAPAAAAPPSLLVTDREFHPPSPEAPPLGSPLRSRSFATAQQGGEEGEARVASERAASPRLRSRRFEARSAEKGFRPTGGSEGATGLPVGLHATASVLGAVQFFHSTVSSTVSLAHWMVAEDHPVSSFLLPVESVAASAVLPPTAGWSGEPVVWGLVKGQRVPIVSAGTQEGRRTVSIFVDPSASPAATSLLVVFFNSLRWLMAQADVVRTGDPLLIPGWGPGQVTVRRPDGNREYLAHAGGMFRYDATNRAGVYRIAHGNHEVTQAVNFLDPLESNLMDRASTWQPIQPHRSVNASAGRTHVPLSHSLLVLVIVILVIEWSAYRGKSAR